MDSSVKKPASKFNPLLDADSSGSDSDGNNGGIYGRKINHTKQGIKQLHLREIQIEGFSTFLF